MCLIVLALPFARSIRGQQSIALPAAERATAHRHVWAFDAQPEDGELLREMDALRPASDYDVNAGFGWVQRPSDAFVRHKLARSRDAAIIDGVAGARLRFKVDALPGDWQLILWLDVQNRSTPPPNVVANGAAIPIAWPNFQPDVEPSSTPSKLYSVTFGRVAVGDRGVLLELSAPKEGTVRLLAMTLLREPCVESSSHAPLARQIAEAGRHRSNVDLDRLLDDLKRIAAASPDHAWAAYWKTRLAVLQRAEQLYAMRGWESAGDATGLGMFDRLHLSGVLLDGMLGGEQNPADLLSERARWLRGRLYYWLARQRGGRREAERSRADFQWLARRYPDDPLLAMYLGRRIDTPDPCDTLQPTPGAPAWSNAQREALCRMRQIVHWWVLKRQATSGEFGGKWGDDVELLRWWAPLAVIGDPVTLQGWQKLADGVWNSRHVSDGYAAKAADVEHAAEFVADTASLLAVCSDDPIYVDRLRPSLKHFRTLWTGVTPHGNRLFRSAWFSSTFVDEAPPKGRDVEYNTRAVQTIRYLAWRTGDREATEALHEWSRVWRRAALRTDKQKPAGVVPASIRFPDESFGSAGASWYDAELPWPYYQWEHHCGTLMLDQLLFTSQQTQDESLLDPLRLSLQLVRTVIEQQEQQGVGDDAPAGGPGWAARRLLRSRRFWSIVEQYRLAGADDRWDDLVLQYGTPYGRYRLSGDEKYLVEGLEALLGGVRYNTPLLTDEALHTDRVYVPGSELVKAMLTGDQSIDNTSPYYAVTWEHASEEFTALVREARTDRLEIEVFSHAAEAQRVAMRSWTLSPGRYRVRQERLQNADLTKSRIPAESFHLEQRGDRLWLRLPPHEHLVLVIEPTLRP